jgi:hypothetical protein
MNQNSWITPGIINSCKHRRELHKELQNNNNPTLASYHTDTAYGYEKRQKNLT